MGRLLYSTNKNDILELKKIGYSKINIRFKIREAANNLTSNQTLKSKGYLVYIPSYRTIRKSIFRGVPLSEGEILSGLESAVDVLSVQRLGKRGGGPLPSSSSTQTNVNSNVNNRLTPSRTILILFRGQTLPDCIYLYIFIYLYIRYPIVPFISKTSLYFKCFRFGAQCKNNTGCIDCSNSNMGTMKLILKKIVSQYVLTVKDHIGPLTILAQNIFFKGE